MSSNIEKSQGQEKYYPVEINRVSILSYMFTFRLERSISDFLVYSWLDKVKSIQLSKEKANIFLAKLEELNISKEQIESVRVNAKWIIEVNYLEWSEKRQITFDILAKDDFFLDNPEKLYAEQQEISSDLQQVYEQSDTIVDAMHMIFMQNEDEVWDELDDSEDKLTKSTLQEKLKDLPKNKRDENRFTPFENMNLKQLSKRFKELITHFDHLKWQFRGEHPAYDDMLKTKEHYLEMLMWIGDRYEWWADYLEKTSEEVFWKDVDKVTGGLLFEVCEWKSTLELLDYIREINEKIDDNNYQSTAVEESYKTFSNKLNKYTFDRLVKEDASKDTCLEFVKIISWKSNIKRKIRNIDEFGIESWYEEVRWTNDVDDDLKSDPENMAIMNDVVLFLMTKKWGLMDKISESKSGLYELEDEKVWEKDVGNIVSDFKDLIEQKIPEVAKVGAELYIKNNLWYWDILDIHDGQKYSDLSFQQKAKISVVYRVLEKLKTTDSFGNYFYDNALQFSNYKYSWEYYGDKNKMTTVDLSDLFKQVAINANEDLVENMTEKLQDNDGWLDSSFYFWRDASELWLTDKADIEIYNFFKDFQWVWALDFSERSISNLKTTWKFVAVMAVAMAVLPVAWAIATSAWATGLASSIASMWAISQWGIIWVTASVTSIAINPKWYDSFWEWVADITTDILVWMITWMLWWKLVQVKWVEYFENSLWKRVLLTAEMKKEMIVKWIRDILTSPARYPEEWYILNKLIFAWDLMFLWLLPEAVRMMSVDSFFHKDSIFSDKVPEKESRETDSSTNPENYWA